MKTMRKLYDHTMDELDGVMEYSKCAIMHAQAHPELSKVFLQMAKDEMEHAKLLDVQSKALAESKMGEGVDPMLMELWEEMEACKVDKMGLAKACLDNAMS